MAIIDNPYEIEMDADCINQDYDVASDIQHQLEEIIQSDTDIQFE